MAMLVWRRLQPACGGVPRACEAFLRSPTIGFALHASPPGVLGQGRPRTFSGRDDAFISALKGQGVKLESQKGEHPIGSFVEYNSVTFGGWIIGKVEGYDEDADVYILDVQPEAKASKVRAVHAAAGSSTSQSTSTPVQALDLKGLMTEMCDAAQAGLKAKTRSAPPPSPQSIQVARQLGEFGVDAVVLSNGLLKHFKSAAQAGVCFSAYDTPAFAALLEQAYPQVAHKAGAIADVLVASTGTTNLGLLGPEELLLMLRAGSPMRSPEFQPMMWDDQFRVGVGAIDADHAAYFEHMTDVIIAVKTESVERVRETVSEALLQTETHFAEEEAMLERCDSFEGWELTAHKMLHVNFLHKLGEIKKDLHAEKASAICDLVRGHTTGFMKEWMWTHIISVDSAYKKHLDKAGIA